MDYPTDVYYTGEELDRRLDELGIERYEDGDHDYSGTYKKSARAIFFPFSFSDEALELLEGACCSNPRCQATENLTLDHKVSVSAYFNREGYLKSKAARREWYSNRSNLQVLCRSCNAAKGGEGFDPQKVAYCIQHKLA
ncbi:MAG: HNH endonuclease [Lachnospiraceae bacterium]|nr:HNH endonuclease [Lachnospiraceae bacterium]MDE7434599.1 HNH endonuclease [Lachnospiraceae bacterium]